MSVPMVPGRRIYIGEGINRSGDGDTVVVQDGVQVSTDPISVDIYSGTPTVTGKKTTRGER